MNRIISCNGFFATINYEAGSKISFEQSDLFLSHDIGRFITSGDVFQKVADCISSFLKSAEDTTSKSYSYYCFLTGNKLR